MLVIKHLNVFKDTLPGIIAGFIALLMNKLFFLRAEEAFSHSIIRN